MKYRVSTSRLTVALMHSFAVLSMLPGVASSGEVGPAGNRGYAQADAPPRGYRIPLLDLSTQTERQIVVDREPGQYLGHPTTVLLEDGRTVLCVYPKGHGRGAIVYKRSSDGGLTWSERLPTPASWATSKEVPTIHRVVDAQGKKRLILWSGLRPARLAVSEDDGGTWSELKAVGDWGGIVVMGCVEKLSTPGHYLAMFHDDGRFLRETPQVKNPVEFTLYQTFSTDGGLTWSAPEAIHRDTAVHLCEPGCIRSPDGKQLAVLLRENSRRRNSHVMFSNDEGRSWTKPRELPGSLTGDRHTGRYAPDGRLFVSFRDTTLESPTKGDWVAWVGTYDDIVQGREGQYRVRLMKNHKGADCAYPGVEVLPDGTIVTTTYGHWTEGESPYIVSVRLKLDELDRLAKTQPGATRTVSEWLAGQEHRFDGYTVTLSQPVLVGRSKGYLWFPSLSKLSDGRLLTVMTDYADTHTKISTARLAWSRDGGLTWSPLVQGRYGDPTLTLKNGDELLLPYYLRPRGEGVLGEAYQLLRRGADKVEVIESGVRVQGWPRPDRSFAPELGLAGFVFNGDTLVDRDGRHLAMLYGYFAGANRYALVLAESADGIDWQIRATIADENCKLTGGEGPCEAALCRLRDGRLMCVFRLASGVPYGQTFSSDDGRTWSEPRAMPGVFSVQPSLAVFADGMVALSGGRPGLFLWLNRDGQGESWDKIDLLVNHNAHVPAEPIRDPGRTSAYTEVVVLDDRHLLYIYDRIPNGWSAIPADSTETNSVWVVRVTLEKGR